MSIKNSLKCLGLFLASTVFMTIIIYLTAIVFFAFNIHNEYIAFGFMSVLYSTIVLLFGYKLADRFKFTTVIYFIFTTLIPALLYNILYGVLFGSNTSISISSSAQAESIYFLIFMCIAFAISTVIVAIVELLRFLINKRIKKNANKIQTEN